MTRLNKYIVATICIMDKAMQHLNEFCSKRNGEAENQITGRLLP